MWAGVGGLTLARVVAHAAQEGPPSPVLRPVPNPRVGRAMHSRVHARKGQAAAPICPNRAIGHNRVACARKCARELPKTRVITLTLIMRGSRGYAGTRRACSNRSWRSPRPFASIPSMDKDSCRQGGGRADTGRRPLNCTIERATHAGPPSARPGRTVFTLPQRHFLLKRLTRARCTYFGSRSSILF